MKIATALARLSNLESDGEDNARRLSKRHLVRQGRDGVDRMPFKYSNDFANIALSFSD